jgi:ectoine hydroxylase-related dioxygenase (phytanoyl-CoA dioxygenase family)
MTAPITLLETTDHFPSLESDYDLTPQHYADFAANGHVLLRSLATPTEMAAYRPPIAAAVDRLDAERQKMEQIVAGGMQGWKFVQNLWEQDAASRKFVLAKRFAKAAAHLLGVSKLRLFRDQSYFKSPGGGNTAWHQDAYFMPLDTSKIITLWIALSDVTEAMSPMFFFDASHQRGYLGASSPGDLDMDSFEAVRRKMGYGLHTYGPMVGGDATFHSGWTLHGSRANNGDRTREALVIVYYADGAKVADQQMPLIPTGPDFQALRIRRENLAHCLPGCKLCDVAATHMNPVVYEAGA